MNTQDDAGNTALHMAALRGFNGIVTDILDDPMVENLRNEAGYYPSQIAISPELKDEIAKELLTATKMRATIAWIQHEGEAGQT